MVGGLRFVVIRVKCHPNRLRGYGAVGVENGPSPLLWPVAYTTDCITVQAVMFRQKRWQPRKNRPTNRDNICSKYMSFQRTVMADPQRDRQTNKQTDRQENKHANTIFSHLHCSRRALFNLPKRFMVVEDIETILKAVNLFRPNSYCFFFFFFTSFFLTGRTEKFGVTDRHTVFLQ